MEGENHHFQFLWFNFTEKEKVSFFCAIKTRFAGNLLDLNID